MRPCASTATVQLMLAIAIGAWCACSSGCCTVVDDDAGGEGGGDG